MPQASVSWIGDPHNHARVPIAPEVLLSSWCVLQGGRRASCYVVKSAYGLLRESLLLSRLCPARQHGLLRERSRFNRECGSPRVLRRLRKPGSMFRMDVRTNRAKMLDEDDPSIAAGTPDEQPETYLRPELHERVRQTLPRALQALADW